jgi:hypothetical protein
VQTVSTGSGTTKRSWDLIFRPGNSSSPSGTFIIQFYHYLIGRKDVINIQYNGTNFDTTFDSDIIMSNRKIKELPTPTTFDQPATKGYADSLVKNIPASSLANYPSDNTKYLRGDGVWSPVSGGGTSSGATVGDFKFSCIGDDHAGWTLWIQNRVLSRTTYKALYDTVRQWALVESDDPKINIPNAIFGRGDGGTTFTMKDISSRYIGISGQNVSGLTTRLPCVRVGAETITSVPNHSHTMSHTHNATISTNNHTHSTSGHTHSINHTHSSFNTTSFSHSHDLVTFNLNGTNSSLDTVVYQYTSQSSGSGGGYTDYDGSGGVTPFRVIYNVGLRKTTSSVSQSLNINIPTFSGTSGGSSETISSASHTHTCDISSNNSSTGSTGDSSVNVMNPGIFFEMFIYTGALEPPEL